MEEYLAKMTRENDILRGKIDLLVTNTAIATNSSTNCYNGSKALISTISTCQLKDNNFLNNNMIENIYSVNYKNSNSKSKSKSKDSPIKTLKNSNSKTALTYSQLENNVEKYSQRGRSSVSPIAKKGKENNQSTKEANSSKFSVRGKSKTEKKVVVVKRK
jgi:hypothetical protein